MKCNRLIQLWVDEPSYGLVEKYCQKMEVDQSKFFRDALRAMVIQMINEGLITNDTEMHNNHLFPKPMKGRPRKVKPEVKEPAPAEVGGGRI